MNNRVVHFEIQADDLVRCRSFYQDAFGWRFEDYGEFAGSPYYGVITGEEGAPGINGGLLPRPAKAPGPYQGTNAFVCTIQVDDYDTAHDRILKAGGQVAMPKTALTGMAWQGYYLDTEGNIFGLHQADENAG
ncbi:MAG: VOC family protein [Eubacteriales bacterium]|nr:VOC family protein [Eubacteriales bacterium]